MIVRKGPTRISDQYAKSPTQTIRITRTTRASLDALSVLDPFSATFTSLIPFSSLKNRCRDDPSTRALASVAVIPVAGTTRLKSAARSRSEKAPQRERHFQFDLFTHYNLPFAFVKLDERPPLVRCAMCPLVALSCPLISDGRGRFWRKANTKCQNCRGSR
jgi:hypothetical protein